MKSLLLLLFVATYVPTAKGMALPTKFVATFGVPGKGPGVLRGDGNVPPAATIEFWLGSAALKLCTVDNVRGLQKCCEVKAAVLRGEVEEAVLLERYAPVLEAICEADGALVPFRPLSQATLDEAVDLCALGAAGGFMIDAQKEKKAFGGFTAASGETRSPTKGLFNVFSKATEAVSIFGLADEPAGKPPLEGASAPKTNEDEVTEAPSESPQTSSPLDIFGMFNKKP